MAYRMQWILALAAMLALAGRTRAAEGDLTAMQIVEKSNHVAYYQGADGRAHVKMTIVDDQDRTRLRELSILRWDAPDPDADPDVDKKDQTHDGQQKFYVYFHAPADLEKMALLVHKHSRTEDDRWLYVPNLDLVKRIAGKEKRTSFAGSNFFYEDISGRNINLDNHELESTTENYYVLRSTPTDPDMVDFRSYKTWIHRKTFLVVKQVYLDSAGREYRQYDAKKVEQIDGYWTVTQSRMTDLLTNRYTDLVYTNVKYNLGLPEEIFTERYLRKPPVEHLGD